jgi:hypothetical protein
LGRGSHSPGRRSQCSLYRVRLEVAVTGGRRALCCIADLRSAGRLESPSMLPARTPCRVQLGDTADFKSAPPAPATSAQTRPHLES